MRLNIGRSFTVVLLTVLCTFNSFYSPQPLLPIISEKFNVAPTSSALLLTIPFVLLCFSPIIYGALLRRVNARIVLIVAVFLLATTQLLFAYAANFQWLLISRTLQSILYPAIFTASITYCSKAGPTGTVAHRVSLYVASTIVGGLCGRLFSGFITSRFGWPNIFELNSVILLLCAVLLFFVTKDSVAENKTKNTTMLGSILKDRTFLSGYLLVFTTFFAFSATLNALPFRLVEIEPDVSAASISLVYAGYLLGVFIAMYNQKLCQLAGGRIKAMTIALTGLLTGFIFLLPENLWWLVSVSFLTAASMFLIHSTLSGFLTGLMPEQASVINGLYISIYYAAGASGSLLPLWIYHYGSWQLFLFFIFCVAATGFITLRHLALHPNHQSGSS